MVPKQNHQKNEEAPVVCQDIKMYCTKTLILLCVQCWNVAVMTIVCHPVFQNHEKADQTDQELIHLSHVGGSVVVAAFAAQDTKKFYTRSLILVKGQKKNKAVMTVFCHPENLHYHKDSGQTS